MTDAKVINDRVDAGIIAVCPQCGERQARAVKCYACQFPLDGDPDDYAVCVGCDGWHLFVGMVEMEDGWYCEACAECLADEARDCPMCHGSGGGMDEMRCPYCRGTGTRETEDDIDAREYAAELRADEQRDKEGEK